MNQKKAGVILSYISEAVKILTLLLYTPIMLRLLGQSEYGLYQLVNSVVSYLGLLSLGFTAAYIRYYSIAKAKGAEKEVERLNGMFMTIFLIIAGIAAICGAVMLRNIRGIFSTGLSEQEYETARILMAFMVFNLCISFPNSVFSCIISAHERFFFQRLLTVAQNFLNPFLTLPLLLIGYGAIGMVTVSTVIAVAMIGLNAWYVFKKMHVRFAFDHFDFVIFKDLGKFTFFIFLNQIIDQVNWSVDKFLLGRMLGTVAVAVYGLGAQINTMYVQFSTAISSVFAPQINRMVAERNDNHELSGLFTKVGRIQFMLLSLILSGFIFMGHPFMELWGGSKTYGESYYVALLLMIPVTVPLIQNLGIEIQRARNKHQARSVVYFCIAIANIFLSIPLIKLYGSKGAALGTALSLLAGNILFMNWYYARKIDLEIITFWKSILSVFPAFILPGLCGLVIRYYISIDSWFSLFASAAIYGIVFCISLWMWGMNQEEKKMLEEIYRKMVRLKSD